MGAIHFETTIIPIDARLAERIQVGDTINYEVTIRNMFPHQRVLRAYKVMVVDRINELIECRLLNEVEI